MLELGLAAQHAGFDGLWLSKQLWPLPDGGASWPIIASIARRTHSIALGVGVARLRESDAPAVLASSLAAVRAFSPDRVFLAIGAGQASQEIRAQAGYTTWLDRVLRAVRQTACGSEAARVYVGGDSTSLAEYAGRHADGWIVSAQSLFQLGAAFRRGASLAKKDPNALPVLVQLDVVVGGTAELEQAAELSQYPLVGFAELLGDPDRLARGKRLARFDPFRTWLLGDDPDIHVRAIRSVVTAGATDLYIHSGQRDLRRVIHFYGQQVLPLARAGYT
jgi:coenzyme F420-dependent glucose-6-phosphate dehydrogenase